MTDLFAKPKFQKGDRVRWRPFHEPKMQREGTIIGTGETDGPVGPRGFMVVVDDQGQHRYVDQTFLEAHGQLVIIDRTAGAERGDVAKGRTT